MMKNPFYFILKAFFVLKIFVFLSQDYIFVLTFWKKQHVDSIRKTRLVSKLMKLQPEKQTTAINLLPNILRSKGNQAMKFGELIKYNMRNFFLENDTENMIEKFFPDSFLEKQNWAYL